LTRVIRRIVAPADADPGYLARRFRADGPVFRYRERGRRVVAIVGIERSGALLEKANGVLEARPLPFSKLIPRGHLRYMSDHDHEMYRRALAPVLSVETCQANEDVVRRHWAKALAASSRPHDRTGMTLGDATHRLLAFLAVGEDAGPAFAGLLRLLPVGRRPIVRRRFHTRTLGAAVRLLEAAPLDAPTFWSRARAGNDRLLDDPTFTRNFVYSLRLGAIDLAGLLHWILDELARNPDWAARCGERNVAAAVVRETLRLHRTEFLYRRARRRLRTPEVEVPRGAFLRICIAESHRDPTRFPDADSFDPSRFLSESQPARDFQPFGPASSRCLGSGLTLFLARLFVEEASRWNITVAADRPPVHDGFHWQPGSAISLSPMPSRATRPKDQAALAERRFP
jgi:cytochrome P450